MGEISYSWIVRFNIVIMSLLKFISRFMALLIKISTGFSAEIDKLILKFTWKCKGARIVKIILKKDKIVGFILPDFTTYYTVIKSVTLV